MPLAIQELRLCVAEFLGAALLDLFPDAQLVGGGHTSLGFYYDILPNQPIGEEIAPLVEERLRGLLKENLNIRVAEMMRENAMELFNHRNQQILVERLHHTPENIVALTQIGEFYDFCQLPEISSSDLACALKIQGVEKTLLHLQGLPELEATRVYGTAFFDKKDLKKFLKEVQEGKKWDHRFLGKEMALFDTREETALGSWFWLPRGARIRSLLLDFWRQAVQAAGSVEVFTPNLLQERLLPPKSQVKVELGRKEYALARTLAPQHALLFRGGMHAEAELPLRYSELFEAYRDISPSELAGMIVASQYQKDITHIFCSHSQLQEELISSLQFIEKTINIFGFESHWVLLTSKGRKTGNQKKWQESVNCFIEALRVKELEYREETHEKPECGPRLELQLKDALGRYWRVSYIEVDLHHPGALGLHYQGSDGEMHRPAMIRWSLFGSLERFAAILVERFSGNLPLWLAPEQVRVIPIAERHLAEAVEVQGRMNALGLRAGIDRKTENLAARIHSARMERVPYLAIIGDNEQKKGTLSVRTCQEAEGWQMKCETLSQQLLDESANKLLPSKRKLD